MTSNIVKCSTCNIVINELLSFMQNKIMVMDEDSLIRICEKTAFAPEEIECAKKLLFEAIPMKKIKARKKDKARKDLEDIIKLFKHADASDPEKIPIFVAKDLNKLLPVTFDHLDATRVLRDIQLLNEELRRLRNDCITREELDNTLRKSRFYNFKNVNNIQERCPLSSLTCDSGPMGLQHCYYGRSTHEESVNCVTEGNRNGCPSRSPLHTPAVKEIDTIAAAIPVYEQVHAHVEANTAVSKGVSGVENITGNTQVCRKNTEEERVEAPTAVSNIGRVNKTSSNSSLTMADVVKVNGEWKQKNSEKEQWTMVEKRKKYRYNKFVSNLGKASDSSNFNFKAADI